MATEPGIPSRDTSSLYPEYVTAFCTHRPSLLPIGLLVELRLVSDDPL